MIYHSASRFLLNNFTVTVVVTGYCSENNFYQAMTMMLVAGYNKRTSGMKRVFRLFCVPVVFHKLKRVVNKK